jgi:acyl carrier protein
MSDIREKCAKVMAKVFEVDVSRINDETNPDNLPQWDSLGHVQMILELEKMFTVKISPEEGIDLESFEMVVDCIGKKL